MHKTGTKKKTNALKLKIGIMAQKINPVNPLIEIHPYM